MNIGIVTGASSGMGREMVRQIAAQYPRLDAIWVIARRKKRLQEFKWDLAVPVRILPFDLTEEDSLFLLQQILKKEKPIVRILVNAAGVGRIGALEKMSCDDCINMIDLNCRALTAVTYLTLPYMKRGGRIVLFSSLAAFLPQPRFAVYAATKAYVLSFSRALGHELKERQIIVTAVCPGPVDTEFFVGAEKTGRMAEYKKKFLADAKKVVQVALKDARMGKEVSVYGTNMKMVRLLAKLLPHKLLLDMMDLLDT